MSKQKTIENGETIEPKTKRMLLRCGSKIQALAAIEQVFLDTPAEFHAAMVRYISEEYGPKPAAGDILGEAASRG